MKKPDSILPPILLALSLIMWGTALYRDLTIGAIFPMDLRNRVVGARLIHDGISPYFYKWKAGDPIRYYDPMNFNNYRVSVITASPFFHHLIMPLAALPQSKIQTWWVIIQHSIMLIMVALAIAAADTKMMKYIILLFATFFLHTDSWKLSIENGQNYLFIPLLALCVFYIATKKPPTAVWGAFAGLCAILLILIRPNAAVFFLPAILLLKTYDKRWLAAFFVPILLLGGWSFLDKKERNLWIDYRESISQHIKIHQKRQPDFQVNAPDPHYAVYEGATWFVLNPSTDHNLPMHVRTEIGNIFYIAVLLFHYRPPYQLLMPVFAVIAILLTLLFHYRKPSDPAMALLFGYCLYMIGDVFSPVTRPQYYSVQLLFLILVAPVIPRISNKWVLLALFMGILLNITHFPFIKMQHTLGEYLIIGTLTISSLIHAAASCKKGSAAALNEG